MNGLNVENRYKVLLAIVLITILVLGFGTIKSFAYEKNVVLEDTVYSGSVDNFDKSVLDGNSVYNVTISSSSIPDGARVCMDNCSKYIDSTYTVASSNDMPVSDINMEVTGDVDLSKVNLEVAQIVTDVNIVYYASHDVTDEFKENTGTDEEEDSKSNEDSIKVGDEINYSYAFEKEAGEDNVAQLNVKIPTRQEELLTDKILLNGETPQYSYDNNGNLSMEINISDDDNVVTYTTKALKDEIEAKFDFNLTYDNNYDAKTQIIKRKEDAEVQNSIYGIPYPDMSNRGTRDYSDAPSGYGYISTEILYPHRATDGTKLTYGISGLQTVGRAAPLGLYLGYEGGDAEENGVDISGIDAIGDDTHGANGSENNWAVPDMLASNIVDYLYNQFELGNITSDEYDAQRIQVDTFFNSLSDETINKYVWDGKFSFDDETGFVGKVQNQNGSLSINPYEDTFRLDIPYIYSETLEVGTDIDEGDSWERNPVKQAKVIIWIDLDLSGTFDKWEAIEFDEDDVVINSSSVTHQFSDMDPNNLNHQLTAIWDFSEDGKTPLTMEQRNAIAEHGTYMRAVITSDMSYGPEDGGKSPKAGTYGEIEDYRLESAAQVNSCGYSLVNSADMLPENIVVQDINTIVYEGIDNIYSANPDDKIDIKVNVTASRNNGSKDFVSSFSGVGSPIDMNFKGTQGSAAKEDNKFKIEFFDSATGEPVEIPVTMSMTFDRTASWIKFDQKYERAYTENDGAYEADLGNTAAQFGWSYGDADIADIGYVEGYWSMRYYMYQNGGRESDLSSSITFDFSKTNVISGTFGAESEKDAYDNFANPDSGGPWGPSNTDLLTIDRIYLSFPKNYIDAECPDSVYEEIKTSNPESGTEVEGGDTIDYKVELQVKGTSTPIYGINIGDVLDEEIEYVDGSATLTHIDYSGNENDITDRLSYDASSKTFSTDYDEPVLGGEEVVLEFQVTVSEGYYNPAEVRNIATASYKDINGDIHDDGSSNETVHPLTEPGIISLKKEIISPTGGVITDSNVSSEALYKVTLGPMIFQACGLNTTPCVFIDLYDNMEDPFLSAKEVTNVYLTDESGSHGSGVVYTEDITDGKLHVHMELDDPNFGVPYYIAVEFKADVSSGIPEGDDIANVARAYVNGVPTGKDTAYLTTEDTPQEDVALYVDKFIDSETGDTPGTIDYGEDITYSIKLQNTSPDFMTIDGIEVKDDLTGQNLDQVFNYDLTSSLNIVVDSGEHGADGVVSTTPSSPTIGDLINGFTIDGLDYGEIVAVKFTVTAKGERDMPYLLDLDGDGVEDETVNNMAVVTEPSITDPITPIRPILPPESPIKMYMDK